MEEIMDLDYFKQKIEKREKKIKKLDDEIDNLLVRMGDYRMKNCKYKKGNKCMYDDPLIGDDLECFDCGGFEKKEE